MRSGHAKGPWLDYVVLVAFSLAFVSLLIPAAEIRVETALEHLMLSGDPERARNLEIRRPLVTTRFWLLRWT